MLKKITFYVFIIASIAGAIYGYYYLSKSKEPTSEVTEHIPNTASCIIQTSDFSDLVTKLCRQNLIWNALQTSGNSSLIQTSLFEIDSLISINPEVNALINNNKLYWSIYIENTQVEQLILFKIKENTQELLLTEFFEKNFSKNNSIASFNAYELKIAKKIWNIAQKDGIVYLSSDISLLETSISLSKDNSIAIHKPYHDLIQLNGAQNHQVYINHDLSHVIDNTLFLNKSIASIDFQVNQLSFNGYTQNDSNSFFSALANQQQNVITQFEHLPNNPIFLSGITVSNPILFHKNLLNSGLINDENKNTWQMLNDIAMYNVLQETLENIDNEIVTAKYSIDSSLTSITSIKVKERKKTEELINYLSDSSYQTNDLTVHNIKEDFQSGFLFHNLSETSKYVCLYEDGLYLFSNATGVNLFQESIINGQILGKNPAFMDYASDNLTHASNYFYYENLFLIKKNKLKSLLLITEVIENDKAISYVALTANNYKNTIQYRLNISQAQQKSNAKNSFDNIWETQADTSISSPIYLFTNHNTKEQELCYHDENNNLYLTSSTGNVIWKKQLAEKIQSSIYTVDVFKNGKFQLLFNTENYLHLIDRNGNYVQGYPVKVPSKITSNITLLDYENTKDYRLFIACNDNRIYNYNLYGIKTEGFLPVKTMAAVTLPIQYAKVGQSDYLITADTEGKIYIFSRKGEGRIDLKNKTITALSSFYIVLGNNLSNTKLIYVDDKNNLLNKISFTDAKETVKFGDELTNFETNYSLINDDAQMDLLLYGDGAIYAYDLFSNKLVEYFQSSAFYSDAEFVSTSKYDFILAHDKAGQKIDFITLDGKLKNSIPSSNKPLITNLFRNDKSYLLLVQHKQVVCKELK